MDYNDKLEALEREQSELRQMIGEGITFDVEVTYTRRNPGLLGFFRKREKITEKKVFRVQETKPNWATKTISRPQRKWQRRKPGNLRR